MMKKFNVIDIIILVFLICIAVIGAVTVVRLRDEKIPSELLGSNENKDIVYEILFEKSEEFLVDELKNADTVYGVDSNECIGKVIDVRVEPFVNDTVSVATGQVVKKEVPEQYDVYMIVEAKGKMLDNGVFMIGDAELFPTKAMNIKGKHFYTKGKIWSILEVK